MMLLSEEDNTVRITHYINPHCFWYKLEATYVPNHEQRQFLDEFNEYCERQFGYRREEPRNAWYTQNEPPKVGDLVAQHNKELERWIRCVLDDIMVDLSGDVCYQLWALDEGLPIKSMADHVRPLPKEFSSQPGHAQRGAVKNILPCETTYDYLKGRNILTLCAHWCTGIASTVQTLIDDALSVSMVEQAHCKVQNEVIHFVDIFLKTHEAKSFNIVDLLRHACSDQLIVSPDEEFFQAVRKTKTLTMVRYKNNDGVDNSPHSMNFIKGARMKNNKNVMQANGKAPLAAADPTVQNKVGDWFSRNMKATVAVRKNADDVKKMIPPLHLLLDDTSTTEADNSIQSEYSTCAREEEENTKFDAQIGASGERNIPQNSSSAVLEQSHEETDEGPAFDAKDVETALRCNPPAPDVEENKSVLITRIKQIQLRRQQQGLQSKPRVTAPAPLVGAAGCSLLLLYNAADKQRLSEKDN